MTDDLEASALIALAPDDITEEALDQLDDGTAEQALEAWEPLDIDSAAWAAMHLTRRRNRINHIRGISAALQYRTAEWERKELERLEADTRFFEGRLRAFHERALQTDPRAKTIPLPDGTQLRSQAGKVAVEVTDNEALQAWAEMEGCADVLFRMKDPEPNLVEIGKRFSAKVAGESEPGEYAAITDDGVVLPGVSMVRKPRSFTVSTGDEIAPKAKK